MSAEKIRKDYVSNGLHIMLLSIITAFVKIQQVWNLVLKCVFELNW